MMSLVTPVRIDHDLTVLFKCNSCNTDIRKRWSLPRVVIEDMFRSWMQDGGVFIQCPVCDADTTQGEL